MVLWSQSGKIIGVYGSFLIFCPLGSGLSICSMKLWCPGFTSGFLSCEGLLTVCEGVMALSFLYFLLPCLISIHHTCFPEHSPFQFRICKYRECWTKSSVQTRLTDMLKLKNICFPYVFLVLFCFLAQRIITDMWHKDLIFNWKPCCVYRHTKYA